MRERRSIPQVGFSFGAWQARGIRRGFLAALVALTVWPFSAPAAESPSVRRPGESSTSGLDVHSEHSVFVVAPLTSSGVYQARHLEDRDHVSIIELSGGSYDRSLPDGGVNAEPRTVVAREFFATHPDEYDFLVVFTTFEFNTGQAVAFHLGIRNEVQGIGLPVFDNTAAFGSDGKLQGYIDMAALTRYGTDPLNPNYDFAMGTLAHEMQHQWCCYVDYSDGGTPSRGLIGQQNAHWNYLLDTDASVMYGSDWKNNGNGTYTANAVRSFFSPLDLYLAGLYGAAEVPPMTLLVNPAIDGTQLPLQGATVTATPKTVQIADVIAAMGPRVPAASESQKIFRIGFVLVTRPGIGATDAQVTALNHLRDGLYQRFPALTGGRGIVQVYPEARVENPPGSVDPVTGGPLRPGQANLNEALTWLRERQAAQGFWQDTPATRVRDTAVVLPILNSLDATFVGQDAALDWLTAEPKPSADDRARTVVAFEALANGAAALRAELLATQNADGGWGLGAGYGSVPLDTALALQALAGRPTTEVPPGRVAAGVAYLRATQGADGGWGATPGGASRTGITAEALAALKATGENAPVEAALTFLAARQNVDGGFGDSPSTAHDTARALQGLMSFQALGRVDSARAASYLLGRQSVEGSWEGSVYTTALTVAALRRFSFPNWSFEGTPTFSPERPADGERVEIRTRVANSGNAFAPAGAVRFYDGDPAAGGTPIGADVALPPLAPGQVAALTTLWDTRDRAGLRTIFIVIDPEDALPELSELDNRLSAQIEIITPPGGADLEVRTADLSITPSAPNLLPSSLAISIAVRNLGLTAVPAARVVLRRLEGANPGPILAETTLAVPSRASVAANFSYQLETPGDTTFLVEVDPDGAVAEATETNNRAQVTISTQPSLDLAVTDGDLELIGGPALLGRDVTFRVTLKNRGTLDSPDARVRYRVTDGTTIRELGENLIQPRAGQSVVQNLVWRVDLTGDLTFTVELDRQLAVPELDETNNNAALAFTAVQATAPNLAVSFRDLAFSPLPGLEGSPETISIQLRNTGATAVTDAVLAFYDGDPGQGGVVIDRQTIASLDAGASTLVSYTYPELPDARDRLIFAVADPDGTVTEADETDNVAFETLPVLSLPDLTISAASLDLEPRFPRPGQQVTLTVSLANLGEQPAQNVAVRVYDGEPASGGTPVAPDQVLAQVAGLGPGQVSFTWNYGGSTAPRPLVAVLDPEATVREGNEGNNRAALDVVVQDGDFFVTERFFSPDGDGNKDSTTLFFRLDPPGTATVEVLDRRDKVVRSSLAFSGSAGEFPWDGLDQRGRVVRDGDYRLRLITPEGVVRGVTTVTVDTNRSSLIEAVGTEFELFSNLTCEPRFQNKLVYGREEDDFIYEIYSGEPFFPPGFYKVTNTGGDLKPIISANWSPQAYVQDYVASVDGTQLAYVLYGQFPGDSGWQTWVANSDGTGARQLADDQVLELFAFSQDGRTLYGANPNRDQLIAIDVTGFLPPRTVYTGSNIYREYIRFSPDRKRVAHREYGGPEPGLVVVDLDANTSRVIAPFGYEYPEPRFEWSPDSTRLAIARAEPPRVDLYDRAGTLIDSIPIPLELPPYPLDDGGCCIGGLTATSQGATSFEDYAAGLENTRLDISSQAVAGYGGDEPRVREFQDPQWASSSTELALYVRMDAGFFVEYARILRLDVGQRSVDHVAWTQSQSGGDSYHVDTWDGAGWQERAVIHFGDRYQNRQVDLTTYLPDSEGEYKVRLRQIGKEAAHVDRLALLAGPLERRFPTSVIDPSNGQDFTARLKNADNDVADLWGKTVIVEFGSATAGRGKIAPVKLELTAREEDLSTREVSPFSYPSKDGSFQVTLAGDGALAVDGLQSATDDLGAPLFRIHSRPITGHPPADVLGWVKSDSTYLYGALDFTVDNTIDGEKDWGSIEVLTADGWQEFRITATDRTHGQVGFTRTAPVHHEHKYYEFKVPFAKIGATAGDTVSVRFRAYGTAASCEDDPENCEEDLLELYGRLKWVPNERTLYYGDQGYGRGPEAIFLDDENARRTLFNDWFSFYNEEFTSTGRRLLFDSEDFANDPLSACYQLGTDRIAFSSLANLTVDLRPRRSASSSGILLEGTATDRHFKNYRLEYSTIAAPNVYNPVAPPSSTPVIDDRLTTWVPPGPGTYFVRLTVEDLAGNLKSRIKRVASSDQPSITDLYREPEYISPNGDGVQDATIVHYRVLEPVHLEFQIYNSVGDRVRTLSRDHSVIGTVHEVAWDGRGTNGLPVPDGEYRLVVQDYEFFVKVDSTPPAVTALLEDAFHAVFNRGKGYEEVVVAPAFGAASIERNHLRAEAETGVGENPFIWEPFTLEFQRDPDNPLRLTANETLTLPEATHRRYRLNAVDKAGNRATASTPLTNEELIVEYFGPHVLLANGSFATIERAPAPDQHTIRLNFGDVRFAVAETIDAPILQLFVQFKQQDQSSWNEVPIERFLPALDEIQPYEFEAIWDMVGIPLGQVADVRLRAVDERAGEHFSNKVEVLTDGLFFGGVLQPSDFEGPYADILDQMTERAARQGLIGPNDLILWGVEYVPEVFENVVLPIKSPDDPRYTTPVPLEPVYQQEGGFLWVLDPYSPCLTYGGNIVATTVPSPIPRTLVSNGAGFTLPCLEIMGGQLAPPYAACGEPRPAYERARFKVRPLAYDGVDLVLLTIFQLLEDGTEDILYSVNRPEHGRKYEFDLDIRDLPEGTVNLFGRLSNGEGRTHERVIPLWVDRTEPERLITLPRPNQRLCGIPRQTPHGIRNVLDIEGLIDDAAFAYQVDLRLPRSSTFTTVTGREGCYTLHPPPRSGRGFRSPEVLLFGDFERDPPLAPSPCESIHGGFATWGDDLSESEFTGDATARVQVWDRGGFHVCEEVDFFFDGEVEGPGVTGLPRLFSPNADGVLDEFEGTVTVDETARVTVTVVPGETGAGTSVRTLLDDETVFDAQEILWDGKDDGGSTVPDGKYTVKAAFEDGCGNRSERTYTIEVDNTPPALAIVYPQRGDPLPMIVAVQGTVTDLNLAAWNVDYGLGLVPETWARIAAGVREVTGTQPFLGSWNINGLVGETVVRFQARDRAGNSAEVTSNILITSPVFLLIYAEAVPELFSPNGDGRRETQSFRFGLDSACFIRAEVRTPAGAVVRVLEDGSRSFPIGGHALTWNGLDQSGNPAPDGVYAYYIEATLASNANVTQEETVTAVLDRTPPTIAMTSPNAGFVSGRGPVAGSIFDVHLTQYLIEITDEPGAPAWEELASGTLSRENATFAVLSGLEEGDYALRIQADDEGEIHSEQRIDFTVDNTPPVVALTAPEPGSVIGVARDPHAVEGAIDEANLDVWRLEYGLGGDPTAWLPIAQGNTVPTAARIANWAVAAVPDGEYTLRLTAVDKAGQTGQARLAVVVDNTPPEVEIDQPGAGDYVTRSSQVLGTASDLHLVEYQLEVAAAGTQSWQLIGNGNVSVAGGVLLGWEALPPDGDYQLRLTASDAAGNTATTTVAVRVDQTPPRPPIQLVATSPNGQDAELDWTPNTEPDLAGYYVYRDGTKITPDPVPNPEYLDLGLTEGPYVYKVTAVDHAGNESAPSNEATVAVDRTPPVARISRPSNGDIVSGLVDIVGTAYSADDFKEYRLYIVNPSGGGQQLLRRSPVPIQSDVLGQWNTLPLPEGAAFRIRLEAEDLNRNVAVSEVDVTVDNTPPAAPTGLVGVAVPVRDGRLTWNANTEPDLDGYLLFRDGRIANATGVVVGDLTPYIIRATTYLDRELADGTYTYELYAIDQAGNLSDPSQPAQITIDTRPPHAVIVDPPAGTRFGDPLYILATTEDNDVDRVQFQYRAAGATAWIDLGPADTGLPWEANLDPVALGLSYGDYELRAVATDRGGQTDPAPESITVTYTDVVRPDAAIDLTAHVDGGDVTLEWTASPSTDVVGYHLYRRDSAGAETQVTFTPVPGTTYLDAGLPDAQYFYWVKAIDGADNLSDPSNEAPVLVYTPTLERRLTPTVSTAVTLTGCGLVPASTGGTVTFPSGSFALPAVELDGSYCFSFETPLGAGRNDISLRLTDPAGNISKAATLYLVVVVGPSAPTGLTATAGLNRVDLTWNPNPETNIQGYRAFRDGEPIGDQESQTTGLVATASSSSTPASRAVDGSPSTYWAPLTPISGRTITFQLPSSRIVTRIEADWLVSFFTYAPYYFDLDAWDGIDWVRVGHWNYDGTTARLNLLRPYGTDRLRMTLGSAIFEFASQPIRLGEFRVYQQALLPTPAASDPRTDGRFEYTVTAVDAYGFESPPSAPATAEIGDVEPPPPVVLTAQVADSDVTLTWTASAAPDVAFYELFRDGELIASHSNLADLSYVDVDRPNGTYIYTIRPVDGIGNLGALSNEAPAIVAVAVPDPPIQLTVIAPPGGGRLDLAWQAAPAGEPAVGYRVHRSLVAGGPYEAIADVDGLVYPDEDVTNGTTYYYVVTALDELGNESAPSNEASGTPEDTSPPAAPFLHYPGYPGRVHETTDRQTPVMGTAEPGNSVELFRGGVGLGDVAFSTEFDNALSLSFSGRGLLSPNGRYLWLTDQAGVYIYAEDGFVDVDLDGGRAAWAADSKSVIVSEGQDVSRVAIPAGTLQPLVTVNWAEAAVPSPDGRRLAILGEVDFQVGLFLYDLADDSFTTIHNEPYWWFEAPSLVWSPLGDRLAYRRHSPNGAYETVDLTTLETTVLTTEPWDWQIQFTLDGGALVYGATDPSTGDGAVFRWNLPDGPAERLTPGFSQLGQLSPDQKRLAYVDANGFPVLRTLATGEETSLYDVVGSTFFTWTNWTPSGYLLISNYGFQSRVEPAGRFEFPPVQLLAGDNAFTAQSTEPSGLVSPRSEEMVVRIATGDRPDLAIAASDIVMLPPVARTGQTVRISVTVENRGTQAAPASEMAIVVVGPNGFNATVLDGPAVAALAPGGRQTVVRDVVIGATAGTYTVAAGADPRGRIAETDELNNRAQAPLAVAAPGVPVFDVATDRTLYPAGSPVVVTARVTNGDDEPFTGSVALEIVDAAGFLVETLPPQPVTNLPFGQTVNVTTTWDSTGIFAGDYRVAGELLNTFGDDVASDAANFALGADSQLAAQVTTDRGLYELGALVRIDGAVTVLGGNTTVTGAEARLTLFAPNGDAVAEWTEALADLLPGALTTVTVSWPSTGAALGEYRVTLEVLDGDNVVATAETTFGVTAGDVVVAGDLELDDRTPALGQLLGVTYTIENLGATRLDPLPFTIAIEDPGTGAILSSQSGTTALDPGAEESGTVSFSTSGLSLGNYPVVLRATVPAAGGGTEVVTLRIASFTTVDEEPPVVTILQPPAGGYLGASLIAQVRAVDALSLVRTVEVSVDGGAWQLLTTGDPSENRYDGVLAGLSEGPHRIRARATDSYSNTGESAEVEFTVDTTPPQITVGVVTAGGEYLPPVAPTVEIVEEHPATQSITLNGVPYVSGTPIPVDGNYVLQVSATDLAGNRADVTVPFTVFTPPSISIGDATVAEGNAGSTIAAFPLVLSSAGLRDVTVTYTTGGGTATAGADYLAATGTVTIPAGTTTGVIEITVLGDLLDEVDETFEVTLSNAVSALLGDPTGLGTILDDDAPSLSIGDVSVTEGNAGTTNAVFTVSLSAPSSFAVSFDYATADGTATAGTDYAVGAGSVTIPAGETTATISVAIAGDLLDEADETFTVVLGNAQNATIADGSIGGSGTGTIVDDDGAPSLSVGDVSVTEGNSVTTNAVFTVSLTAPSSFAVSFDYATANGTATAGVDYTAASGSVTIPAGQTSATISVAVLGDLLDEADETFTVTLGNAQNATLGDGSATGTIVDDDGAPSLSIADVSVTEGNSGTTNAVFTVTLAAPSTFAVSFDYATANGTALAGVDYTGASGSVTIPAGQTTATISVAVLGDLLDEADETFTVTLANAQNATISDGSATGTIVDDDGAPSLSIADVSVTEGNSGSTNAVFTVTLSTPSTFAVSFDYATADGTALASVDYTAAAGSVTIPAGQTSATVTVAVTGDLLDEADEAFTVTLGNAQNATLSDGSATGTIVDDDAAPSLSIADVSVTEGNSGSTNAVFTVSLTAPSSFAVSFDYSTANGTATAGADYTAASGPVTIPAGQTTATISVAVLGDVLDEPDETFTVTLGNAQNATISDSSATGTIVDDDGAPSLSIGDVSVTEGNSGSTNATLTVTLSAASSLPVTFTYQTADGTATAGADYTAATGTRTIPAGQTSTTLTVAITGDTVDEPDETVRVLLTAPVNALVSDGEGVITIVDDDVAPVPAISVADLSVPEAAGTAFFQVTLSIPAPTEVRIAFTTVAGTATAGADFGANSGTLVIAAGQSSGLVPVTILNDAADEPDETFRLVLSSPVGATIADGDATATILDDDAPAVTLSIDDVTVTETDTGTVTAVFTVRLSAASTAPVTVAYATQNGTATAGADYTATSGTLTFPAGTVTKTIPVAVLGDNVDESNETFLMVLSNPSGATLADGSGTGTIVDEDGGFCPRSPGYWKTHTSEWPVQELELGGVIYRRAALLDFLGYGGRDMSIKLARQLVATKFNLLKGSSTSIQPVVDAADDFLEVFKPGSDPKGKDRDDAEDLKNDLDKYNNDEDCHPDGDDDDDDDDDDWTYTDETGESNLGTKGSKEGALVFCDFNRDGWPDVLANQGYSGGNGSDDDDQSFLYFNNGDGTFRDVTNSHARGIASRRAPLSALCGDLNNDGYVDLVRNDRKRIEIYLNKGPSASPAYSFGGSQQGASQAITTIPNGIDTEGLGLLDFDRDGDLDLVISNGTAGVDLYTNNGSGTFSHATPNNAARGLPTSATSSDYAAVGDWNGDGKVDFLARLEGKADLWRNLGNGNFGALTSLDLGARNGNKGGSAFCDLDSDGDLDLIWTDAPGTEVYENDGGTFKPTGEPRMCEEDDPDGHGHGDDDDDDEEDCPELDEDIDGVACADADNDGDIDFFLSGDKHVSFLFENRSTGAGQFEFRLRNRGIVVNEDAEEAAFADIDLDGDLDLAISIDGKENQLWESHAADGASDDYLVVRALRCLAPGKYRDDLGARVRLFEANGTTPASPVVEINGGRGHGSQDYAAAHFGLPQGAARPYVIEVRFQGTGSAQGPVKRATVTPSALVGYNLVEIKSCSEPNLAPKAISIKVPYEVGQPAQFRLEGDDPEGHPLLFLRLDEPLGGGLLPIGPELLYTPRPGTLGVDQFRFVVDDGENESAPATVILEPKETEPAGLESAAEPDETGQVQP